jgi:hypothetical protein
VIHIAGSNNEHWLSSVFYGVRHAATQRFQGCVTDLPHSNREHAELAYAALKKGDLHFERVLSLVGVGILNEQVAALTHGFGQSSV